MKKSLKVIMAITLLAIMGVMIFGNYYGSFAITPSDLPGTKTSAEAQIKTIGNKLVGVLQAVGVVTSVVILIVLGIKYMMGSAEEKAEYKKTFIPYIVGAALIFSASMIAGAVINFIQ